MRREIPGVRILPMSDRVKGFAERSVEEVQRWCFLGGLPRGNGRWRYRGAGLNADPGTVVLFQFRARIIASAVFLRDEKFERAKGGVGGVIYFEVGSILTFEPVDVEGMRKVWAGFRRFGHVKQFLNPGSYPNFKRRLKNVVRALG